MKAPVTFLIYWTFFFFNVLKFKCLCFIVAGRVHALQYIYLGINRSLL